MKHWLFLRAQSRPPDWERMADGVNLTSITIKSDEDGKYYTVPVNKTLGPETKHHHVKQWPHGQTLLQFDKDVTSLAVVKHKNGVTITQSFITEALRDEYNSRIIDLDFIERTLEKKNWCALGVIVKDDESVTQNALLQNSRYIVRDNEYKLFFADTNELCAMDSPVKSLLLFVAFKLGRTNAHVLVVNPNIISLHGELGSINQQRSITATASFPNIVPWFAFAPKINCELVNNAIIVNRGELEIAVGDNSVIHYLTSNAPENLDFTVECSWEYKVVDNIIRVKKQAGVGYIKIITPCIDMTKQYISAEDRKITLEYILLGV
jgi:hypothetical protein